MASASKIEWTEQTWNPVVGCSLKSPGCTNCYAMPMAARLEAMFAGTFGAPHYKGLTEKVKGKPVFTGKVALAPDHILIEPLKRKKPTMYFVNSMGDLFHESVPDEWILRVLDIVRRCSYDGGSNIGQIDGGAGEHTFQVLTKRAQRMAEFMPRLRFNQNAALDECALYLADDGKSPVILKNLWLGVSTERQKEADERIPHLLATPAAVRFISAEPLLGPIDLEVAWHGESALNSECWGDCAWCKHGHPPLHNCSGLYPAGGNACVKGEAPSLYEGRDTSGLDWVIVGGESGPAARPMNPEWLRSLRDQCADAGVPFFFKQWGAFNTRGFAFAAGKIDQPYAPADGLNIVAPWSEDDAVMVRVGKKAAGRLLDGKEHNEFPEAHS